MKYGFWFTAVVAGVSLAVVTLTASCASTKPVNEAVAARWKNDAAAYRGGLSLDEAASLARKSSPELKTEAALAVLRAESWKLGRRAYFPSLSVSADENDRLSEAGADSFAKSYSLVVEQPLFDGGRLAASRKLGKSELALASARLDAQGAELEKNARALYRSVLVSRAALSIRQDTVSLIDKQFAALSAQYELGAATLLDMREGEMNRAEARIALTAAEIQCAEAEKALMRLLRVEKLPPLSGDINKEEKNTLPDAETLRAALRERNTEIESARFALKQRETALKVAKRGFLPNIRAKGTFTVGGEKYPLRQSAWSAALLVDFATPLLSTNLSGRFGGESEEGNPHGAKIAGASAKATPLPDPAALTGVSEARLLCAAAREKLAALIEAKESALDAAIEQFSLAEKKREAALERRAFAARKQDFIELKYSLGAATAIDRMEASLDKAKAELAALEAAENVLAMKSEIEFLTGLSWEKKE